MKQCPRPADRVQLGQCRAQLGRFCMSNIHKQLAPVRHPETNNSTSWAPGSLAIYARPVDRWAVPGGSLGADRGPRIACAGPFPADRWAIASRSCARWAVPGHMFGDKRARPAGRILRVFHWA